MKRGRKAEAEVQGDLLDIETAGELRWCGRRRRKVCRSSIEPTSTRSHCLRRAGHGSSGHAERHRGCSFTLNRPGAR